MRIGLVADSRGDVDALEYACDLLVEEKGAERLFFLGGNWADLDELFARKRAAARGSGSEVEAAALRIKRKAAVEAFVGRFSRVPERGSSAYRDPSVSRILPELVGDKIACLVHDKSDLRREDIEMATLLLHGNAPSPAVAQFGTRFFVTPGPLTGERGGCALLSWEGDRAEFAAVAFDGRELDKKALSLVARRRVSAG